MRPEPVALLDEQRLAGHAATIQLVRSHLVARPPSASEPDRHHHRVFPALLHLPGLHGALLDLDEFRPAPEPGGAAAVAEGVNASTAEARLQAGGVHEVGQVVHVDPAAAVVDDAYRVAVCEHP